MIGSQSSRPPFSREGTAETSYAHRVGDADLLLIRTQPLTAATVAAAKKLRFVSRHGVGYDAIDAGALAARGIPLAIVGDVNSAGVANSSDPATTNRTRTPPPRSKPRRAG